jgi:Xaa-Pro dipeptidase
LIEDFKRHQIDIQTMSELESKIHDTVAGSGLDAVMAVGVDNFHYLTRTVLPFAENYPDRRAAVILPRDGKGVVLCPVDWSEAVRDQGWGGEIRTYDENDGVSPLAFVEALKRILDEKDLSKSKIGLDLTRVTKGLMDVLRSELPGNEWVGADTLYRGLRIVKTPYEVALIETACQYLDRGIIHALNHLEGTVENPGYTVAEFTERTRVHAFEDGISGVGHMSTTLASDASLFYVPQRGVFRVGIPFKADFTGHYKGYWADSGRMAYTGKTPVEYAKAYEDNMTLKKEAVKSLRPGVRCSEVHDRVKALAKKGGIPLWGDVGIGHGVGASHHEPPYLTPGDNTELEPGMVVAVDVLTIGPGKELIHSKDIYVVEEEGSRLLSWYRNWDRFYEVTGFRAAH